MQIIAIHSGNTDLAGALVYWRLSGDVNGDDLNNALSLAGLDEHTLTLPSPRAALRRTMQELQRGPFFLRAAKGQESGLYVVHQSTGDNGPEFRVWIEARLSIGNVPKFKVDTSINCSPHHEDLLQRAAVGAFKAGDPTLETAISRVLTQRFWHHVFHVSATDISGWLIDQAGLCDALNMRDGGGVYFIPRAAIDRWRLRADCLKAETACRVYMIPAMNSEEAFGAVLDSLIDECTAFTTTMQQEITSGMLGAQALQGRADRALALLEKLGRYEELLGTVAEGKLADIRTQIEEQKTNAIEASLLKAAEEEDQQT